MLYSLQSAATLTTPVAINWLLTWTEAETRSVGDGVRFVVILAAAAAVSVAAEWGTEHVAHGAGLRCRALVASAITRTQLGAPLAHSQRVSSGELVALFTVDAGNLTSFWHSAVTLVIQPLEILANVGLLGYYVQWAAAGGVAVVIAAIAITNVLGGFVEALMARRATVSDGRLRDTLEMLLGMKVVKMNGWETRFQAIILAARAAESALSRRMGRHLAAINVTASNSVDVISLAVLVVYTVAMRRGLTPATTFTYWVLLGLLHAR